MINVDEKRVLDEPFYYSQELILALQEQITDDNKAFEDFFHAPPFDSTLFDDMIARTKTGCFVQKEEGNALITQFLNHFCQLHQHIDHAFLHVRPWINDALITTNLISSFQEIPIIQTNNTNEHLIPLIARFALLETMFESMKQRWKVFRKQAKTVSYHPPKRKSDSLYASMKQMMGRIKTIKTRCCCGVLGLEEGANAIDSAESSTRNPFSSQ